MKKLFLSLNYYTIIRVCHNICQYLFCDTYVKKTALSSKKQLSFPYGYCICSMADTKFINYVKKLPDVCYWFCFIWTG